MPGRLSTLVGFKMVTGPNQNLVEGLRDSVRRGGLQDFLNLARGAAVGITLDGDDDSLPDPDVAGLQRRANGCRRPELDGSVNGEPLRVHPSPRFLKDRHCERQTPLPDILPLGHGTVVGEVGPDAILVRISGHRIGQAAHQLGCDPASLRMT